MALRFSDVVIESRLSTAESSEGLRVHFARELHDQVASPLVGLVIELHNLRNDLAGDTDVTQRLAVLEESARQALRRTREMVIDLRGQESMRLSFEQVLRNEVLARFERRADILLHVSRTWPQHINGWAAFNLSRIVHEAVTNAVRHGRARCISIILDVDALNQAVIEVVDDGTGFDGLTGLGITGMQERAVIMGGSFSGGSDESGTRIEVRIPAYRLE